MRTNVRRFDTMAALCREAAEYIRLRAEAAVREKGFFTLVLSGGRTPKPLYRYLARPALKDLLPWAKTHLFWGDERCVPPEHPDSNFRVARDSLLSRVGVPPGRLHRIPAEKKPPEEAARSYEDHLRRFFSKTDYVPGKRRFFPSFDLILLGAGEDGHTASLFPGDKALQEKQRWIIPILKPGAPPSHPRITMTLPLLNSARHVLFLASQKGKERVLKEVLAPGPSSRYPAGRVRPKGELLWLLFSP